MEPAITQSLNLANGCPNRHDPRLDMNILEHRAGPILVMVLDGRLDHAGAEAFRKLSETRIDEGIRALLVDFQGVSFVASMGIRALIVPYQKIAQLGGRIGVLNPAASVKSVFELAGMDKVFKSYSSEAEALEDGPWMEPVS